jgi:hypothetical protein
MCDGASNLKETGERITITGATESGEIKVFTGILQSIDYFPAQVAGRQYRVTILDTYSRSYGAAPRLRRAA